LEQQRPADSLLPLLYDELRALAERHMRRLQPGQTVQATALVHEVYLKLAAEGRQEWAEPREFFVAAARAMRNLVVDRARHKGRLKHGGAALRVSVEADMLGINDDRGGLLDLDEAIEALAAYDARKHEVVLLRTFTGLGMQEIADTMGLSLATVERDWAFSRAWLARRIADDQGVGG
jgi:RNA polymerase sigma factor (TIGR02999 family)